jgi:uncharacterized protein YdiU (UPF0061 family)
MAGILGAGEDVAAWLAAWRARAGEGARVRVMAKNPVYVARNHLVERAIVAGVKGDFSVFEQLNEVLGRPFEEQAGAEDFARPAAEGEKVLRTFCGT